MAFRIRPGSSGAPAARAQAGFTYLGVLFAVAVFGVAIAATGELWSTAVKRDREEELLRIGNEFRGALGSYYVQTPAGGRRFPNRLDDLLHDPRHTQLKRHLRQIYVDPITRRAEWGLVREPNGGIVGVYSLSRDTPLKSATTGAKGGIPAEKTKYSDWRFEYVAPGIRASAGGGR